MNLIKELDLSLKRNSELEKIKSHLKNEDLGIDITGSSGFFTAYLIYKIHKFQNKSQSFILVKDERASQELEKDLSALGLKYFTLPFWSPLIYQGISSPVKIFNQRVDFLVNFYMESSGIYIIPLKSLLSKIPKAESLLKEIVLLEQGSEVINEMLAEKLVKIGYTRSSRVTIKGEFTIRGEIIDIFPYQSLNPLRIILNFNKIEEIKSFESLSQRTLERVNKVLIFPKKEYSWNESKIKELEEKLKSLNIYKENKNLVSKLREEREDLLEEFFYNLIGETFIREEMKGNKRFLNLYINNLEESFINIYKEHDELFERSLDNNNVCSLETNYMFTSYKNLNLDFTFNIKKLALEKAKINFQVESDKNFNNNIMLAREEFKKWSDDDFKVIIAAHSKSQEEKLKYLFKDLKIKFTTRELSSCLIMRDEKIALISEKNIFKNHLKISKEFQSKNTQILDSFIELEKDSLVVHINHGIGIFRNIKRIKTSVIEKDYVEIEYAEGEKIFVPIEQTNLIQKYIGGAEKKVKLDKIGSKSWERKKLASKKRIEELANKLIEIYSKRESMQGFAFPKDNDWMLQFESEFPYNETKDQLIAIKEIKADMESAKAMDRLLCGDVGFGKTEVAMRAAFKAVLGGKQVVVLTPTTILCEQHISTFKKRFSSFPIKIAMLNRFLSKKECEEIIESIKKGEVDIIIATHKILSNSLEFKNLGLLIIDEEQRFGVSAKEKLKEIKATIDCLSLSATPIPRTLHMSLIKLRDISVLKTPPSNRIAIKVELSAFNEFLIKHAIERELEREGQVFFIHNKIDELGSIKAFIEKIVPQVRAVVIHSKLKGETIENIMHDFINNYYQVLISTTIIENGIDIPNANTIIINNAEKYGLSQLYQLKGRVGRSNEEAFAYFLYHDYKRLNDEAVKRLKAISENIELGVGFKIAMKDMEIRGVGNLLGREQHGDIEELGFDYYIKLLNEAIEKRIGREYDESETLIEINYTAYIPESFVSDEKDKILIYKKISSIVDEREIESVKNEIKDRFGEIPEEVNNLFLFTEIKILCKVLKIKKLKEERELIEIEYNYVKDIPVERAMKILKEYPELLKISPKHQKSIFINIKEINLREKLNLIYKTLHLLL